MNDVSKLYKILRKDKVSYNEFQFVMNNENVKSIETKESDNIFYARYDVYLNNGELYYLSVKKPLSMLLSIIASKKSSNQDGD